MSSLRTFVTALRTGETRTTKAIEHVVGGRRSAAKEELLSAMRKRGAMNAPLAAPFRRAMRRAPLPERYIAVCIDGWPDSDKARMRRAVIAALDEGRRVRFRWGLTGARGHGVQIDDDGAGPITITALSPRSSLRVERDEVHVSPAVPAATKRRAGATRKG
jgi:hypothetical protein